MKGVHRCTKVDAMSGVLGGLLGGLHGEPYRENMKLPCSSDERCISHKNADVRLFLPGMRRFMNMFDCSYGCVCIRTWGMFDSFTFDWGCCDLGCCRLGRRQAIHVLPMSLRPGHWTAGHADQQNVIGTLIFCRCHERGTLLPPDTPVPITMAFLSMGPRCC